MRKAMKKKDLEIRLQSLKLFSEPKAHLEQYPTPSVIASDILFSAYAAGDIEGMKAHMKKHAEILRPRFEIVLNKLGENLDELGIIRYNRPRGGYFVCVDVLDGTAKRVVELCKEAGVNLTGAGATYPYGNDPHDSNIRIAPSFPSLEDLASAMDVFCLCARIAALEKLNV